MVNKDFIVVRYSKTPCIRTLNFKGQAAVQVLFDDYKPKYQTVRFLNRFLIYETIDVHDNLHFIVSFQISRQ